MVPIDTVLGQLGKCELVSNFRDRGMGQRVAHDHD